MTISEWAPNTSAAGLYVGLVGDFQALLDRRCAQACRCSASTSETNQVGFIDRLEDRWRPVLEETFVRVKLA